ncbi:hypothetical protein MNAB215_2725 [Mycobacterium numidiamassiliense]|uniref:Transmembrane protein n=1 Tax=Mycobacterium numidiamassiliense TaxID=1841861 RepID=A0A2U3P9T6_9MYCO|nr:hypothetical protein [Mycobacterium numidiamassiliense]SPM40524.1 hypothetical protein MNAB215_2725 [Mycobacterium numidiamassiliense]
MAEAVDPYGVRWSVRRRRWYDLSGFESDGLDFWSPLIVLLGGWWPFWFIAHWLGLRWRIVIERDDEEVGEEWVRGWRKSGRRIQEIIDSATAGTLPQSLAKPPEKDPA